MIFDGCSTYLVRSRLLNPALHGSGFLSVVIPSRFARQRKAYWANFDPNAYDIPGGIQLLIRWRMRLLPLNVEFRNLRRRIKTNKLSLEPKIHKLTKYFVRFPYLTDDEFADWAVVTDSHMNQGYSYAEFVRSPNQASGQARVPMQPTESYYPNHRNENEQSFTDLFSNPTNENHPFSYTLPNVVSKVGPHPGSEQARSEALVASCSDPGFRGYGLFRGFLSTRVPKRGDLVRAGFANLRSPENTLFGFLIPYNLDRYTHLVIRFRGDGRNYHVNLLPISYWDINWFTAHQFTLYTRGGPYWQLAKIPLSKFYFTNRGLIHSRQQMVKLDDLRIISFTLMDDIEGPFSLELDYIAFYYDETHEEKCAYELYDRTGIMQ